MVNKQLGEELNQLARLLFDSAANKWYLAIGLEIVAGIVATILGVTDQTGDLYVGGALIGTLLLVFAYGLRLQFTDQYDAAETMRRQSQFSEALNWPVDKILMSEWRVKAGKEIRDRLRSKPRDGDFYSTNQEMGPKRLAEMVIESAFYTRYLYIKIHKWIWVVLVCALLLSLLVILVALSRVVPSRIDVLIARVIYSLIPVVLTIDLLGWAIRLGRLIPALREIENGLENLCNSNEVDLAQVLRVVSEYNCQVVSGIPIHNRLFNQWHDEIKELWGQRQNLM